MPDAAQSRVTWVKTASGAVSFTRKRSASRRDSGRASGRRGLWCRHFFYKRRRVAFAGWASGRQRACKYSTVQDAGHPMRQPPKSERQAEIHGKIRSSGVVIRTGVSVERIHFSSNKSNLDKLSGFLLQQ